MATYTITGTTGSVNSNIQSSSATYATALAGSSLTLGGSTSVTSTGQRLLGGVYYVTQGFVKFDTSSIPDGATITAAVLKLTVDSIVITSGSVTAEARLFNWGADVTTADWQASWAANALAASLSVTGASSGQLSFTSEASFLSAIDKTGTTFLILGISEFGSAPSANQLVSWEGPAIVGSEPTLVITTAGPTVTGCSPSMGPSAGSTSITLTGTGFLSGATVTVGGASATSVVIVSATSITCVTPAGSAGYANIVVTQGGDTGTLTNGFFYTDIVDDVVKLVRSGTVVGNDKGTSDSWPATPTWVEYGGAADLWGTTFTPAQANSATTGVVISATGTTGTAKVDAADVTFYYTLPGLEDRAVFLAALTVNVARAVATPHIYKLPRADLPVANDPNMTRTASNKSFRLPRITAPSRTIEKLYHKVEWWQTLSAESNTPGVQVWAEIDDSGTQVQLLNNAGSAGTFLTSGFKEAWFPSTSSAVGHYCQLEFRVPATSATQADVMVTLQDIKLRVIPMPLSTRIIRTSLVIGAGEFQDKSSMRRKWAKQKADLLALADPTAAPIAYRSPNGETGYGKVISVEFKEAVFKGADDPVLLANLDMRVVLYE